MQVKISQATSMITTLIKAKLVPMLVGSPGCGKSQIIYAIAKAYNLKVIDLRLAQCDPTDLCGFPVVEGGKADYVPMMHFPIEGEAIPKGFDGWLLFLDEATSAPPAIQAAAYKLILDRMVGSHKLHPKVAIVAAGNLETDNAIVQPMSTALQSRLAHLELVVDVNEWTNWAADSGLDHRISDFVKFKPASLFTFKPDHTDKTYACPRTWEFTDRILKTNPAEKDLFPLLAGTISEGVASEFITFCKIYKELPTIAQITAEPTKVALPEEPSIKFALTGAIAQNMTEANCDPVMKYVSRLDPEFQVICMREAIRRHKPLAGHKSVQQWIANSAAALF